jgi:hypothetical protein
LPPSQIDMYLAMDTGRRGYDWSPARNPQQRKDCEYELFQMRVERQNAQ